MLWSEAVMTSLQEKRFNFAETVFRNGESGESWFCAFRKRAYLFQATVAVNYFLKSRKCNQLSETI